VLTGTIIITGFFTWLFLSTVARPVCVTEGMSPSCWFVAFMGGY